MNETLAERGNRYGDFATHAQITQDLKAVFVASPKWATLNAAMKEGLEMVAHKIGRILNGDPTYGDSWHDIAGYAKLVEDFLIDKSHADAALAPAQAMWKNEGTTVPAEIVEGKPVPKVSYTSAPAEQLVKEPAPTQTTFPVPAPTVDNSVKTVAAPAPVKTTALPPPLPVSPVVVPDKDGK